MADLDRYPGYQVVSKRRTPSWNDATRQVIDERLAMPVEPAFFGPDEWRTLGALCERIVPQPEDRPPAPVAPLVDRKLADDSRDGYRNARLPPQREAWRRGLAAIEAEARHAHGKAFTDLFAAEKDALLRDIQQGRAKTDAWGDMPCDIFFAERILADLVSAYYAHPTAWSEIGFGGPAGPRGYVRMDPDERDPWEAVEAKPGRQAIAAEKNRNVR